MKINELTDAHIEEISLMLKALSDPVRLRIMQSLHNGQKNVGEIVKLLNYGQANISKHLQLLARSGLVIATKKGTTVSYAIADEWVSDICNIVCKGYSKLLAKKIKHLKGAL